MIVKCDEKRYDKFKRDASRKPEMVQKFDDFETYIQMAEVSINAYELSTIPWKWKKIHKLTGNRANQYAFGISPRDRTICYGNERKALCLSEVTELEIIEFMEDYH